jgi:hypothetical protein
MTTACHCVIVIFVAILLIILSILHIFVRAKLFNEKLETYSMEETVDDKVDLLF